MGESWTTKEVWVEIIFILESPAPEIKLFLVKMWLRRQVAHGERKFKFCKLRR